jgi:hypothetical protein
MYGQFNSRRNLWLGLMSVVALTAIVFLNQIYELKGLQKQWDDMKGSVAAVETVQKKNREFRPWFNSSVPSLTTIQAINEAFPKIGDIWLKQLKIRNDSKVMADGSSKDQNSLLATLDELRSKPGISNLKLKSRQGSNPISFSFEFDWNPADVSTPAQ